MFLQGVTVSAEFYKSYIGAQLDLTQVMTLRQKVNQTKEISFESESITVNREMRMDSLMEKCM